MSFSCVTVVIVFILFPLSSSFEYANMAFEQTDWCRQDLLCTDQKPATNAPHTCCRCTRKLTHTEIFTDHVEFRRNVVHLHNLLRDKLAAGKLQHRDSGEAYPQAANMRAISYSLDLEYTARCWAVNLYNDSDVCRRIPRFSEVGQNLLFVNRVSAPNKWIVFPWWSGYEDYHPRHVGNYTTSPEGFANQTNVGNHTNSREGAVSNFVQMAWAETTHIGCAHSWNPRNNRSLHYAFVCNYGPASVKGRPVYVEGAVHSHCNIEKNKYYTNLCGSHGPIPTNRPPKMYVQLLKETELRFEDVKMVIPSEFYAEPQLGRGTKDRSVCVVLVFCLILVATF